MARNPFNVLTAFQIAVLEAFRGEALIKDFYLTGGTALAAFYLGHRLSEDLDFFTELPNAVARISRMIEKVAKKLNARVSFGRRFETLFECTLIRGEDARVEMDFALDMAGRRQPIEPMPEFGLYMDNRLDIACNKLSALCERSEPKDFVDIYFIHSGYLSLPKLLKEARRKYPGLDNYAVAMSFLKVKDISLWPRMMVPFVSKDLQTFFVDKAKQLVKGF